MRGWIIARHIAHQELHLSLSHLVAKCRHLIVFAEELIVLRAQNEGLEPSRRAVLIQFRNPAIFGFEDELAADFRMAIVASRDAPGGQLATADKFGPLFDEFFI